MMEAELRARPGSQTITYQDAASLARRFGVSYEAAVWRLKSLGHIGTFETNALLGQKDTGNRYMRELASRTSSRQGRSAIRPNRSCAASWCGLPSRPFVRKRSLAAVSSKSPRSSSPTLRCWSSSRKRRARADGVGWRARSSLPTHPFQSPASSPQHKNRHHPTSERQPTLTPSASDNTPHSPQPAPPQQHPMTALL
jgi:hypothetical protein